MLEILVSIVVFSLMSTSIFYFLSTQNKFSANSNDMTRGISLGKLTMDSLKVVDYDALTAGSDTVGERFIRTWSVSPQTNEDNTPKGRKLLQVVVFWPLTAEQTMSFTTLVGDDEYKEDR